MDMRARDARGVDEKARASAGVAREVRKVEENIVAIVYAIEVKLSRFGDAIYRRWC